jgi:tellurite resistance protein TerC
VPLSRESERARTRHRIDGPRVATPLFVVFVALGGTDILFALD